MKPTDLDAMLRAGEGPAVEYKESLSASFARELVAFANTAGGHVLLGVADNGTIKGIRDTNDLRARIQGIARNCDPPVSVQLERIGEVTVVEVEEATAKPVQCSDGFFIRHGAVSQKLTRNEIRDIFRGEGSLRFDTAICSEFCYPRDFDEDKFKHWVQLSGITGQPDPAELLVNIEAAEESDEGLLFRNAGVLFFAKAPRRFFNQAYITCLLGKGTDKVDVLDRKDFDGGLVADIEDALRFVERNTRTAWRIEGLQRTNIHEYPMKAVREAITNAVMHRDWFVDGANVFVEVYSDRLEVTSPGSLPKGMTLGDLGQKSVRRNALIADLLHRIEFIEKAGTGIRRIRAEAREQGCPEPEFLETGFFSTVFRPNPEVRAEAESQAGGDLGGFSEVTPQVTPQVQVVRALQGEMRRGDLQEALGLTDRKHFRKNYLLPALKEGLIEMTVPDKPTSRLQRYRLTDAGREVLVEQGEAQ